MSIVPFLACVVVLKKKDLLRSFLKVDKIKEHFKNKLVGMVLNGYLSLKRSVSVPCVQGSSQACLDWYSTALSFSIFL